MAKTTLFDQLLRHQIYLEGLKSGEVTRINRKMLKQIETIMERELKKLQFDRLDALSSKGRAALAARITKGQRAALAKWRDELTASLKSYAKADNTAIARVFRQHGKVKKPTVADVWADVRKDKIAGADATLKGMVDKMVKNQTEAVNTAIKRVYAEGGTKDDLRDAIRGKKENGYKDGLLRKFRNEGRAVGSTAFQHVKGRVHNAVAAGTFTHYRWVSVIDSATSKICRGRNGKVYEYGKGPVPPAHFHCRSSIVPIDDDVDEPGDIDPPFFFWIQAQPEEFIRDVFNKRDAEKLINGTAKREDFQRFEGIGNLSLDEFLSKYEIIELDSERK